MPLCGLRDKVCFGIFEVRALAQHNIAVKAVMRLRTYISYPAWCGYYGRVHCCSMRAFLDNHEPLERCLCLLASRPHTEK